MKKLRHHTPLISVVWTINWPEWLATHGIFRMTVFEMAGLYEEELHLVDAACKVRKTGQIGFDPAQIWFFKRRDLKGSRAFFAMTFFHTCPFFVFTPPSSCMCVLVPFPCFVPDLRSVFQRCFGLRISTSQRVTVARSPRGVW